MPHSARFSLLSRLALGSLLATTAACAPRAATVVAPAPLAAEPAPEVALRSGPMLGYVTHREVVVWVQTDADATIEADYWPTSDPTDIQTTRLTHADHNTYHTAHITFELLEPGVEYEYSMRINGAPIETGLPQVFTTQQLWQWRTDPPAFTVAFGSCTYVNETEYDRPGDPYGNGFEIFDAVVAQNPDLMLWLGDNTYLREVDWDSRASIAHRFSHDRALPEMRELLATAHNYAVWDDHDYGPNDADRSFVGKLDSLSVFEHFWANPTYGFDGPDGTFSMFRYNDIDFFLLDTRFFRAPKDAPNDEHKNMLGDAQLQWLIDALTTSRAPFKVIVTGSQFVNEADFYETWARYAHERQLVIDTIVERQIDGVIFLSGDRHHGELLRFTPEGGYPLYDFTSSPLTAGLGDARYELENELRVDSTLVLGQRNFGLLRFEGARQSRTLTLESRNASGELLWTHTISASDLSFPE